MHPDTKRDEKAILRAAKKLISDYDDVEKAAAAFVDAAIFCTDPEKNETRRRGGKGKGKGEDPHAVEEANANDAAAAGAAGEDDDDHPAFDGQRDEGQPPQPP